MNTHFLFNNIFLRSARTILFAFVFLPLLSFAAERYNPIAVYLTWQHDPTTTMTIQWITEANKDEDQVYYQKVGENSWQIAIGSHSPMPEYEPYLIHKVELTDLSPGTSYVFRTGEWNTVPNKFRTIPPNTDTPIRFVVGGDMYRDGIENLVETHRQAARVDPMFALVGGDIAYAGNKYSVRTSHTQRQRWLTWVIAWNQHMVTPDGYLIPMIPTIGNHDVNGRYDQTPEQAPFFYSLFSFPGRQGYNALDFGDFLSIIVLDSGHTHSIDGNQTFWLYNTLEKRQGIPHKFAIYHVPAYPSVRKFSGKINNEIRKHWVPIFEHFGLTAAFEHHDHAYKRTHPIYKGRVDPRGVLYLGDGAWGVKKPRKPKKPEKVWFLANTKRAKHFIMVTLEGNNRYFTAIDSKGNVIDSYSHVQ
ncbi:MAG: hypothetical protein K940chlam7_00077 [Chlamydiae bacterium]|nr:hypothetical protein [Chlamydiota bacterium]